MKKFLTIACLLLLFIPDYSFAQSRDEKWVAGISAAFLDFQGPIDKNYFKFKNFSPGIQLSTHAYAMGFLNIGINSIISPTAKLPTSDSVARSTMYIDINAVGHFKILNNGRVLDEDAFFAPYILSGFGLGLAENKPRPYIPLGFGFKLRLSKNTNFMVESSYKFRMSKEFRQPLTHTAGFVFAIPSNKKKPVVKPKDNKPEQPPLLVMKDEPKEVEQMDTDEDGIPDKKDKCPTDPGLLNLDGCPSLEALEASKNGGIEAPDNGEPVFATGPDVMEDETTSNEGSFIPNETTSSNDNEVVVTSVQPPSTDNSDTTEDVGPSIEVVSTLPTDDTNLKDGGETSTEIYDETASTATNSVEETEPYEYPEEVTDSDREYLDYAMHAILFRPGSDELLDESYNVLDKVAEVLDKYPQFELSVMGHTDNIGSEDNNLVLSIKRAFKVKYYLVYEKKIRIARISSNGRGESAPMTSNATAEGRRQNRRVEFQLFK